MQKIWWPTPFYEGKPYAAMLLGLGAGVLAMLRSISLGDWDPAFAGGFVLGCTVIVYAGVVLEMRFEHRRAARRA